MDQLNMIAKTPSLGDITLKVVWSSYSVEINHHKILNETYVAVLPDVVATLLVLDDFVILWFAAAEGDPAGLPAAHRLARAVEVDILVPVGRTVNTAALQPALLRTTNIYINIVGNNCGKIALVN